MQQNDIFYNRYNSNITLFSPSQSLNTIVKQQTNRSVVSLDTFPWNQGACGRIASTCKSHASDSSTNAWRHVQTQCLAIFHLKIHFNIF